MPRKTWVIPSGQLSHPNGGRSPWMRPRSRFANGQDRSLPAPTQRRSDLPTAQRPGRTLTLAYFLGPLGALASNAGRANRFWLLIGAASTAIGLVALLRGQDMAWRLQHGSGYGVLWLAMFGVSWFGACIAWSQGMAMAGHEVSGGMNRLPKRVGNPWFVGLVGAMFPGFGLALSGYPRRAAVAILSYCALGLGALVLVNGRDLWTWNKISHYGGFPVPKLELLYLTALGLAAIGTLGYLVQFLDGVRLAQRKARTGSDHGDVFAFALITALAAFALVFRPAAFAAEFDHLAEWGQGKGFRLTPYALASVAMHLDPSRPDYAMRVADIQESRGHKAAATAIRTEMHSDWAIYRSFAEPVTRRPVTAEAASLAEPAPVATPETTIRTSSPSPAAPSTATAPPATQATAVPLGPETPPVAQGVAAPSSPVKITSAAPATKTTAETKATTTVTKPAAKSTTTIKKKTATSKTTTKTP